MQKNSQAIHKLINFLKRRDIYEFGARKAQTSDCGGFFLFCFWFQLYSTRVVNRTCFNLCSWTRLDGLYSTDSRTREGHGLFSSACGKFVLRRKWHGLLEYCEHGNGNVLQHTHICQTYGNMKIDVQCRSIVDLFFSLHQSTSKVLSDIDWAKNVRQIWFFFLYANCEQSKLFKIISDKRAALVTCSIMMWNTQHWLGWKTLNLLI